MKILITIDLKSNSSWTEIPTDLLPLNQSTKKAILEIVEESLNQKFKKLKPIPYEK